MKKYIFVACAIFFAACTTHDTDEPLKNELLAYTAKFEDSGFLVVGTYLNAIYQDELNLDPQKEHFIICAYPKDAQFNLSSVKVNGDKKGVKAEFIPPDALILKYAAIKIPWSSYFLVSAPSKSTPGLNLTFERAGFSGSSRPRPASLNFQKNSKSLYWNSKSIDTRYN